MFLLLITLPAARKLVIRKLFSWWLLELIVSYAEKEMHKEVYVSYDYPY